MKKLRQWLIDNDIKQGEFANRLGISRCYLNTVMTGKRNISLYLASRIVYETNGDIDYDDLAQSLENIR